MRKHLASTHGGAARPGPREDYFARALRRRPWSYLSPTVEPPRSALTLRLVLAAFGLVTCAAFAVVAAVNGIPALAIAMAALVLVAVADLVVVVRRRAGR
jgi:hypothetical protein